MVKHLWSHAERYSNPRPVPESQLARKMNNARKKKFTPPQRQEPRTTHLSKNIPSGERYRMKHSCKRKHRGVTMPVFQELKEQTIIPIPLLSSIHQSIHQSMAYTRALWDCECVRVRVCFWAWFGSVTSVQYHILVLCTCQESADRSKYRRVYHRDYDKHSTGFVFRHSSQDPVAELFNSIL